MVNAALGIKVNRPGWLYNIQFDLWFLVGITLLGVASAIIVTIEPRLFVPILVLDVWILGYHHIVSTFTQLCFDKQSFNKHRFLVVWLPLICLACVAAIGKGFGVWVLSTIYFYWQWFHYSRQSWGVSQAYRRNEKEVYADSETFSKIVLYSVPAVGILYRMYQSPDSYLGFALWTPEIPPLIVAVAGAITVAIIGYWAFTRLQAYLRGELPIAHTLYITSHIIIFATGYILIEDITHGWLAINIWHNAQYIMFVWLFNNKRHEGKNSTGKSFIADLSKRKNWKRYFLFCLALSTLVYLAILTAEPLFALIGLAPMVIVYQTINFHHYIVDSVIWKSKRKPAGAPS